MYVLGIFLNNKVKYTVVVVFMLGLFTDVSWATKSGDCNGPRCNHSAGGNNNAAAIGAAIGVIIQGIQNSGETTTTTTTTITRPAPVRRPKPKTIKKAAPKAVALAPQLGVPASVDPNGEDVHTASFQSIFASDAAAGTNDKYIKDAEASPKKEYRVANECLAYKRVDNTMFGSVIINNCSYKVLFTFCTVSPQQSGMFNCGKNQFGTDDLEPHKSTAIMGIGVPDAQDPFRVAFGGCEYPGFAHITRISGDKISMVCK